MPFERTPKFWTEERKAELLRLRAADPGTGGLQRIADHFQVSYRSVVSMLDRLAHGRRDEGRVRSRAPRRAPTEMDRLCTVCGTPVVNTPETDYRRCVNHRGEWAVSTLGCFMVEAGGWR